MLEFLRHHLLPHHTNNHRPKVLHHQSLVVVIALLFIGSFFLHFIQKNHPAVLGISANISVQDLLSFTNQKRQESGLKPLTLNAELSQSAEQKAQHMFANNYWAHIAPDGTTPWVFIRNAGYDYLYAGENLARGFTNAGDAVSAWMASPTHRENLLSSNYNDVGFAIKSGSLTGVETILIVQMFGTKYVAKDEDVAPASVTVVSPAPLAATPTPIQLERMVGEVLPSQAPVVAAVQNDPLVDSNSVKKNLGLFILLFFIAVLVVDAIIIERKKIVRVVAHNLDHILFLIVILLVAIIVGKGVIL